MATAARLADLDHPEVARTADELTRGRATALAKLESIFLFVRDRISFGFPPRWDEVTASETLGHGVGYCTTKATLFRALCGAAGVPCRVHFGLIDIRIMRGILPFFAFPFMPKAGGHSWVDVQLDGKWKPLDSYINDVAFYARARRRLEESGRSVGYSVSFIGGRSSCELNFGEQGFVHMGAVVADHGVWDDPAEYFAGSAYPRMGGARRLVYPALAHIANRTIARIRAGT
jgi:hypothetical protein